MNTAKLLTAVMLAVLVPVARAEGPNPAVDMSAHLRVSTEAARHRRSRLLSEDAFIRMSRQPGAIVLDARSSERYGELHVKGAVNLSFPDIAYESLRRLIPDRNTRILIYCNNNFREGEPAFPTKAASASLNLSTYIALYDYGYRNVYELEPLLDVRTTKLELVRGGRR
jgi:phage shock protein E